MGAASSCFAAGPGAADAQAWRAPWAGPTPPPHAPIPPPPHPTYDLAAAIRAALAEDAGDAGDLTTAATIPPSTPGLATFTAKASGVVAGLGVADAVFAAVDPSIRPAWRVRDGARVVPGTVLGTAAGPAASLLIAERVALNFMQRMGGIATASAALVEAARDGSPAGAERPCTVLDTRKTAPCLRLPDKWATLIGGASNHRMGLYDMVMVKDNHAAAAGGVGKAAAAAAAFLRRAGRAGVPIEVEARTLDEVREVLALFDGPGGRDATGITRLMLDNMVALDGKDGSVDVSLLRSAMALVRGCPAAAGLETEASGGVNVSSAGPIASTGVSHLSCGATTHSSPALDISMGLVLG